MSNKYSETIINTIINELAKEGERIIQECVNERTYTHRTYNLHDSYGYGVYRDGQLQKKGFLSAQKAKEPIGDGYPYGRDMIEQFLQLDSGKRRNRGIELVIAAATPYAYTLETGSVVKHRVMSMAYNKLLTVACVHRRATVYALNGGKI